jgi:hypothetical protein
MLVLPKKPAASPKTVVFLKAMPKGGVKTGPVFMLTEPMAQRYDKDPSVLADLMKELAERKIDDHEGNVEIRHPKGYCVGIWQGALSTLDPSFSPPDLAGVTKPNP